MQKVLSMTKAIAGQLEELRLTLDRSFCSILVL